MLVRMLSCRQALLFSVAVIGVVLLLFSSYGDVQPSQYLPKISSGQKESASSSSPTSSSAKAYAESESADLDKLCHERHSILYKDIESTEAYWDMIGGMTQDDLDLSRYICERDGNCPIVKLYNGQLYLRTPIYHDLSFQSRGHSMLLMLSRLDLSNHPNVDFMMNTNDGVRVYEACFLEMDKHVYEAESTSRNQSINHFLFPDFTAFDWWEARLPGFNEARMSLADSAGSFGSKIPKMFWRGSVSLQQGTQRTDLVKQLGPKQDIADVAVITGKDFLASNKKSKLKSIHDMCQYQYIVYTEGVAYSGRLKYTALCNSIQMGYNITFIEFWTHLLDKYYVTVTDWEDAEDQYRQLRNDPERAIYLARGAADMVREHLSPTGISCYIRRMLEGYARSMRWTVLSPEDDVVGRNGTGKIVDTYSWIPLEHFLARMSYIGTVEASQNHTKPITWPW